MRRFLATTAVALVAALPAAAPQLAAAAPKATDSVVGGHVASIAEFPSLAYLEFGDASGSFACTGSVVAPRIILTAGHCVENVESNTLVRASNYALATGVANVAKAQPTNIAKVSQVIVYPGFNTTNLTGDAGLLVLAAPVSAPVLPMASSADAALLASNTPVSIAGWGLLHGDAPAGPTTLHAGTMTVQAPEECQRRTRGYYRLYNPEAQLCALDTPSTRVGGCHGDSGGPAIAHRADGTAVQIGVTSLIKPGCITSSPTVFTRVDLINPWVTSWIAAVEAGGPVPTLAALRPHLPFLTGERAHELAMGLLEIEFRSRFNRHPYEFGCGQLSKSKMKCTVGWKKGGTEYYGQITVFYVIDEGALFFSDHYAIHTVRLSCLRHSPHPRTCPIKTRRD